MLDRQSIIVAAPPEFVGVAAGLSARARQVREHRVDPGVDNLSRIFSEQRAAALDLRLLAVIPSGPGKVEAVAGRVAALCDEGVGRHRAGLQIVYADLDAARTGRWRLFDALRDRLGANGIAPERVRHLHRVRGEAEREALLAECRSGGVSVLVSNSRRMPVDLPAGAVALHHLDCPVSVNELRRREGHAAPGRTRVFRYINPGSYELRAWAVLDSVLERRTPASREAWSRVVASAPVPTRAVRPAPGATGLSFSEQAVPSAAPGMAGLSFTVPADAPQSTATAPQSPAAVQEVAVAAQGVAAAEQAQDLSASAPVRASGSVGGRRTR